MLFIHHLSHVLNCPVLTLLWPRVSGNRFQTPLTLHQMSGDKQQLGGSFVIDIARQPNTHSCLSSRPCFLGEATSSQNRRHLGERLKRRSSGRRWLKERIPSLPTAGVNYVICSGLSGTEYF